MATSAQRQALLAVGCGHCGAAPRTECHTHDGRPVTTLDGAAHDARWRRALGVPAPVLTAVVRSRHGKAPEPAQADSGPPSPEPVSVGAALAEERPW